MQLKQPFVIFMSSIDRLLLRNLILLFSYRGGAINLEQLCITPGRHAFSLHVQIICLSRDGSFFDAVILATVSYISPFNPNFDYRQQLYRLQHFQLLHLISIIGSHFLQVSSL